MVRAKQADPKNSSAELRAVDLEQYRDHGVFLKGKVAKTMVRPWHISVLYCIVLYCIVLYQWCTLVQYEAGRPEAEPGPWSV